MTPNDVGTCEWLTAEIGLSHLAERGALDPVVAEFQAEHPYADASALAEHLVRRGHLTAFQATRLLEGQGRGLVLGPYVLVDAVGAGSMGTVYKALGRADRRAYAVKMLPARSQWNVRQARRHVQAFPADPHPGAVPFLDVGTSAGMHYLVWPFAEGETLEAAVRRDGLLPPARAALIGLHIAQVLQWCDRHRIYHGALKPSNVMLCTDGQTRLLDFGIGAMLAEGEDESLVDTLAGASAVSNLMDCTAPECTVDPAKRSVRGDQYSLGCTLYYGLTGRYPFPDGTSFEKILAHQRQAPIPVAALNPGVPPPLAGVVARLMQKAPEARYNNIDDLINALVPLARTSAVYVPPPPTPTPFLLPRGPTTTPSRSGPSLLSAVQPRTPAAPLPPPAPTPRPARGLSGLDLTHTPSPGSAPGSHFTPVPPGHPSAVAAPVRPPLPAAGPPRRSAWQRLVRTLKFWQPKADPVACTLLAPGGLLPGVAVTLQVVLHHAKRAAQAQALPDWRGTEAVPGKVERGETVGLHLSVHHVDVSKPLGQVEWVGQSVATLFTVKVPPDWPLGEPLRGLLLLGLRQQPVARLEFALPVAAAQAAT
jgi:serine/threonine-protein kinase